MLTAQWLGVQAHVLDTNRSHPTIRLQWELNQVFAIIDDENCLDSLQKIRTQHQQMSVSADLE